MQKHEIDQTKLFFGITMPIAGWVAGSYLGRVPLKPFPAVFNAAVKATSQNPYLYGGVLVGMGLVVGVAYLMHEFGDDGYRGPPYKRFLRGTRMANRHALKAKVNQANRRENHKNGTKLDPIMLGMMPMPLHLENRNLLMVGSPGTGKSVAFESALSSIIRRRDKAVITDPDGTLVSKFFFPGDIILNPFDSRCVGWTIFNEVKSVHDFDRIAKSVIPPAVSQEDERWCGFARDIFADTMRKLVETNNPDVDTLVDLLVRDDGETIKVFLANTDSSGYFRENAERATSSVQFLMTSYVRPLRHMSKGTFSIHEWVNNPNAGNIFITWREDMRSSLKPLVATWVDMVCSAILSLQPMSGNRIWMLLDELQQLGKLESFVPAATNGRRYGLRMLAGLQDPAQLDREYGHDDAKIVLACFRNYLFFAASNAVNADRASQMIGKHQVERVKVTTNTGGRGRSRVVTHDTEPVVMDSEISFLPDLTAYVLFAEEFPLARMKLPYVSHPRRVEPFMIK